MKIRVLLSIFLILSASVAEGIQSSIRTKNLPELIVKAQGKKMLHILAYVREYSTLSTYSDTVFMFREKMVDFMIPPKASKSKKGWTNPRILNSQSYYKFTDCYGLDSVSASSRYHFSWADWIGMPGITSIPTFVGKGKSFVDTVWGRIQPAEIWYKENDKVAININGTIDSIGKKWIPDVSGFYRNGVEFDEFNVQYTYDNVLGKYLYPSDLKNYKFHIESSGRGHEMFRFNHRTQAIRVSTDAEIYILDREYINSGEVKKWSARKFEEPLPILQSPEAAPLSNEILNLIRRIEQIDMTAIRIEDKVDPKMGFETPNNNYFIGRRIVNIIKTLPGISILVTQRGQHKTWNNFKKELQRQKENSIVNDSIRKNEM